MCDAARLIEHHDRLARLNELLEAREKIALPVRSEVTKRAERRQVGCVDLRVEQNVVCARAKEGLLVMVAPLLSRWNLAVGPEHRVVHCQRQFHVEVYIRVHEIVFFVELFDQHCFGGIVHPEGNGTLLDQQALVDAALGNLAESLTFLARELPEPIKGIDDHDRWPRVRQLHRRLDEKLRRRRAARNAIDDQPVGRLAADRRSVEHRREHGHQFGKHDLVDDLQRKRVTLALVLDACPFRLCPGVCPEFVEGRECHELWRRESRQSSDHAQKESANAL